MGIILAILVAIVAALIPVFCIWIGVASSEYEREQARKRDNPK